MGEKCLQGIHLLRELVVQPAALTCTLGGRQVLSIPTKDIASCSVVKNELIVQIADDEGPGGGDALTEIRFYRAPAEGDNYFESVAQGLRKHVTEDEQAEDAVCVLPDLPFVVPRGKYTAHIHLRELKLHGTSYNFTVKYPNIVKAFCMEMPDSESVVVVLGLDKPMRQGDTLYKYAVMQFKRAQRVEVELACSEEYLARYGLDLPRQLSGAFWTVFAQVFKAVTRQNLTVQGDFRTSQGETALQCLVGTKQGHLFVLSRSLLFVIKPIIHLRFEEIARVELHRVNSNSKTFDLTVVARAGQGPTFNSLDKHELEGLQRVFKDNNVNVVIAQETNLPHDEDYDEESDAAGERSENSAEEGEPDDFIAREGEGSDESADDDFDPAKFKNKQRRAES